MTKEEMKDRISMALKDLVLQQGFEIICKNLAELEKEKCELLGIIQGKDKVIQELEKENAKLKQQIEKMKCCNNCKLYQCEKWKNNEINYHFNKCENWELAE